MLRLNNIRAHAGATHKKKRLGRGSGSGHGPTAGKGDKGQLARSGGHSRAGFEGGQTPLYRRVPKRGFKNFTRRKTAVFNLFQLDQLDHHIYPEVSLEILKDLRKVKGKWDRLAILATGELNQAFHVVAHKISPAAEKKILAAGGSVRILEAPVQKSRDTSVS